mgnify:CR=1 FL=1
MPKLDFSINMSIPKNQIKKIATDYEHFNEFASAQIKNITILKQDDTETITEEQYK